MTVEVISQTPTLEVTSSPVSVVGDSAAFAITVSSSSLYVDAPASDFPVSLEALEGDTISIDYDTPAIAMEMLQTSVEGGSTESAVIAVGVQGPQGPPGDEEVPYAKRIDFISDSVFYKGEALPGSATSAGAWRIRKVVIGTDGDVTETWAGGSSDFAGVWDNRASLTYT